PGLSASFNTSASGTGPFNYQWRKDGVDMDGATDDSFTVGSVAAGDAGTYCVVVSGAFNSVTNYASLTVNVPTAASGPNGATVCQGTDANFSSTASGTGPFGYQWTLDGVAVGSNESTLTVNTASLPVGDHVGGLTVNGEWGFAIKSAMLSVQPVTSASGPTDTTACLDQDVSLATVASGTEPFSWQWTLDGNAVGTNGPSLTVQTAGLSLGDHAVDVVVSGPCGSAVTNSARLTVQTSFRSNGPEAASVCHGAEANLLTTASGSGPFTFQWSLD